MKTTARLALALLLAALAGCATPPATKPGDDPSVYRPAHPIHYPAPR